MATPDFYSIIENFSIKPLHPEGPWGCYTQLLYWMGVVGKPKRTYSDWDGQAHNNQESFQHFARQAILSEGTNSPYWIELVNSLSFANQQVGLAKMEPWWQAILWLGETRNSTILPRRFQLPRSFKRKISPYIKEEISSCFGDVYQSTWAFGSLASRPTCNSISLAFLRTLAGERSSAVGLANALDSQTRAMGFLPAAVLQARALIESGQLGAADMTDGQAMRAVRRLANKLDRTSQSLPARDALRLVKLLDDAVYGRPQLIAANNKKILNHILQPYRELNVFIESIPGPGSSL